MNRTGTEVGRARRGLVRAAVSATAAILVAGVGWATPASAHSDADGHGTITLSDTGDVASPPTVTGTFTGASALGVPVEVFQAVTLTVTPKAPTVGGAISVDGCTKATSGKCGTVSVTFGWQIPSLAYNGPYVVKATGEHCQIVCVGKSTATVTPREFRMAADPAAPADMRAETNAERNVALSWQRNGEPDILYYQVFRKDGDAAFARIGKNVAQPASGRVTIIDGSTSASPGGEFAYRVVAVRNGASGDDTTTRTSKASTDRSVTVGPPPTTLPPGTPGGEAKPAGSDVNISSYLSGAPPALPSPKPKFLDLPDTGFNGTLPFGGLPGEDLSEPGEENATPASLETRRLEAFNRGRPLIPIAAGAILLLLAAHLRLLNKRSGPHTGRPSAAQFIATLDAAKAGPVGLERSSNGNGYGANGRGARPGAELPRAELRGAELIDPPVWEFRGVTVLPAAFDQDEDESGEPPLEAWADDRAESDEDESDRADSGTTDAEADDEAYEMGDLAIGEAEADDDTEYEDDAEAADDEYADEAEAEADDEYADEAEADDDEYADDVEAEYVDDEEDPETDEEDLEVDARYVDDSEDSDDRGDEDSEDDADAEHLDGVEAESEHADDEDESTPVVRAEVDDDERVTDPLTDFDDFEWSEESEFAEPEIEVFVGPRR